MEWRNSRNEYKYVMLECWNSGGCAALGNLYIYTVVVVMIVIAKKRRRYKSLVRIST